MTNKGIISLAKKYLGYKGNKFCTAYGLSYVTYWCCIFVWFIFHKAKAGKLFYSDQKVCNCRVAWNWCRAHMKHISMVNARAGDIVFFTWSGEGYNSGNGSYSIDHIGFIERAGTSQIAHTLEGNTGANDPTRSHVMKRDRGVAFILGIYRPKYSAQKKESAPSEPSRKSKKSATKVVDHKAVYEVVTAKGSNIRSGHNTNSKVVGGLSKGARIKTTKKYGNWVRCSKGWVCTKGKKGTYLKKIK